MILSLLQIKVYASTKYHNDPLQFVNKHYFQTKSSMIDENYKAIFIIMWFITVLPLILTCAVSPLTALNLYPIVFRVMPGNKITVNSKFYPHVNMTQLHAKKKKYYIKVIHLRPFMFANVGITIGFLVVHIYSMIRFIQYGDEVLSSNDSKGHPLPLIHAALSLLAVIVGIVLSITISVIRSKRIREDGNFKAIEDGRMAAKSELSDNEKKHNEKKHNEKKQLTLIATLISINIIYIGCYFMPYMILAFIHDPLITIFTYIMVVLFMVCIYLICLGVWRIYKLYKKYHKNKKDTEGNNENTEGNNENTEGNNKNTEGNNENTEGNNENTEGNNENTEENNENTEENNENTEEDKEQHKKKLKVAKLFDTFLYLFTAWGIASSIIIFVFATIYIITLGSFDDFQQLQSLTPSLLIAVLGLFLLKPTYNIVSKQLKTDDESSNNPSMTKEQNPLKTKKQNPLKTKKQNPLKTEEQNPLKIEEQNPLKTEEQNPLKTEEQNLPNTEEQNPPPKNENESDKSRLI